MFAGQLYIIIICRAEGELKVYNSLISTSLGFRKATGKMYCYFAMSESSRFVRLS